MRFGRKKTTPKPPTLDDSTEPPPPNKPFAVWILEILSLLGSVLCLLAILILLGAFNNKPLPNWKFITLNGIISVLSDLAHAALIYPVTEAIGQLKWVWYWNARRPRRVLDFEVFNNASRGPWGSLGMLSRWRLGILPSMGSALVLLGLAMQTFLQLMPNYEARPLQTSGKAELRSVRNYTEFDMSFDGMPVTTAGQISALYNGFFSAAILGNSSSSSSTATLQTDCSTGNCTWSAYPSLGVCSTCADISSRVNRTGKLSWKLADVSITRDFQVNFATTLPSLSFSWIEEYIIVSNMLIFWRPDQRGDSNAMPKAWECALFYCINAQATNVTNGKVHEKQLSTFPDVDSSNQQQEAEEAKSSISGAILPSSPANSRNYTIISHPSSGGSFLINNASTDALWNEISQHFNQGTGLEWGSTGHNVIEKQVYASIYAHGNSPRFLWTQLAKSLTMYMRNQGDQRVVGTAFESKTFVSVRWEWAILPFVLLLGALAVLVGTAVVGRRGGVPVWKNAALPELCFGLEEERFWEGEEGKQLKSLERRAKGWEMCMVEGRLRASKGVVVEKTGTGGRWWQRNKRRSSSVASSSG